MSLPMIGVDDGAETINLFAGQSVRFKCDSRVKAGRPTEIALNNQRRTQFEYQTDDTEFVVGNISDASATTNDGYQHSLGNRVLIHHALQNAGFISKKVAICVGVPYSVYYLPDGSVNSKFIQKKKRNLLDKEVLSSAGKVSIKRVEVVAECLAAWFDLVLVDNGKGGVDFDKDIYETSIGVVDIGGNSIDICSVINGAVDNDLSDSKKRSGMLMVYREIKKLLAKKTKIEFDEGSIRDSVNNPEKDQYTILIQGEETNITELVDKAMRIVSLRIIDMIRDTLHDPNKFKTIYIVGGGSIALRKYLEELVDDYPMIKFPEDPQFANARGMYKYQLFKLAQRNAA